MVQFPDVETMVALAPEDLAWFVLAHAKEQNTVHRGNFVMAWERGPRTRQCRRAIAEAFQWLVGQHLLVAEPGDGSSDAFFVSLRGAAIDTKEKFEKFRSITSLPTERLHPLVRANAVPAYLRGEFSAAVLLAFTEVEKAVRDASRMSEVYGYKLMHAAFGKDGPLTDPSADGGEQMGLANLFGGAIQTFKNAHSHRAPTLTDPVETGDLLIFASRLLHIVDERRLL